MLVEQVMTKATVCCGLDESLESIIYKMWDGDFGAVPVINEHGMPVGMITDRDIAMAVGLRHAAPAQITARALIQGELVTCSPKWELKQALKLMSKEKIRRLPVVDDQYQVVGLLSLCDVAQYAGTGRKKTDVSLTEFIEAQREIASSHNSTNTLLVE